MGDRQGEWGSSLLADRDGSYGSAPKRRNAERGSMGGDLERTVITPAVTVNGSTAAAG